MGPLLLMSLVTGGMMMFGKKPAASTTQAAVPRNPSSKGTVVNTTPQPTKNAASAQAPRVNQGNKANQPWYTGAVTATAGLALASGAKALSGLFADQGDGEDPYADDLEDEDYNYSVAEDANSDSEYYEVAGDAWQDTAYDGDFGDYESDDGYYSDESYA